MDLNVVHVCQQLDTTVRLTHCTINANTEKKQFPLGGLKLFTEGNKHATPKFDFMQNV